MTNKERSKKILKHFIKHLLINNAETYANKLVNQSSLFEEPAIIDEMLPSHPLICEFFSQDNTNYILKINLIKNPEELSDREVEKLI